MEMDTVLIGNRIKEARRSREMTADVLSERIGVAAQTLRHIESGANKTKLQTLINIADTLEVSVDYLLGRVPSPQDTMSFEIKTAYDLTDHQEQMLRVMMENMVPIIVDYVKK